MQISEDPREVNKRIPHNKGKKWKSFLNTHFKVPKIKPILATLLQNTNNNNNHRLFWPSYMLVTVQGSGDITIYNPHDSLINWVLLSPFTYEDSKSWGAKLLTQNHPTWSGREKKKNRSLTSNRYSVTLPSVASVDHLSSALFLLYSGSFSTCGFRRPIVWKPCSTWYFLLLLLLIKMYFPKYRKG